MKQQTQPPKRQRRRRKRHRLAKACLLLAVAAGVFWAREPLAAWVLPWVEVPVEVILQNPELPNGCEAVSMAMLLRSGGVQVEPLRLALEELPRQGFAFSGRQCYGPDPEKAYVGDPSSQSGGWYCFEEPAIQAANDCLRSQGSDLRAEKVSGASLAKLRRCLRRGRAVAVWVTTDYQLPAFSEDFSWILPDGRPYIPYKNLHCVVLSGMGHGQIALADPLQGQITLSVEQFNTLYHAMGCRAVVLEQ